MSEVAEVGFYVKTFDRDIFITKQQCNLLYLAMEKDSKFFTLPNGHRIMMSQVKEVVPSVEYDKSPTGGYHCKKHPTNFVPKGKVCGYC